MSTSILRACRTRLLKVAYNNGLLVKNSSVMPSAASSNASEMNFSKVDPSLVPHYESLFRRFMSKSYGSYVQPSAVFANNELDLSEIEVYGFDYDYTLAVYKDSLHYLIYDLGRDALVKKFGYPEEILSLQFIPDFAIRGLHYDIEHGLLMKIDSFHQIQLGSVYHGLTPVSDEEVKNIYVGGYVPQDKIRGGPDTLQMKQLNDLFSVPEICLLSQVADFFSRNQISYHPEMLFFDVQSAVQSIHPVMHEMLDETLIDKYVHKQPKLTTFLSSLRSAKKKTFLITNSPFKFVDVGMKYMIGPDWTEWFDLIIAQARKPTFFSQTSGKCKPFRRYDPETGYKYWEAVTAFEPGMVYLDGTVSQLIHFTGWQGKSTLYFGDQIYADLADITLFYGWRTAAIIHELEKEIHTLNSSQFRIAISRLQAIEALLEDHLGSGEASDSSKVTALLADREVAQSRTKSLFHPNFGSLFRTHHNMTYFSRRLFRYSDIYMSSLTDLLSYSHYHIFIPRRGALPHEKLSPRFTHLIDDEE